MNGCVITVDAIRKNNGSFFYCLPREELERTCNGAGTKVRIFQNDKIEKFIKRILDFYSIDGCINIELLYVKNVYYLMDINLRLSAGIEFSYLAGADFLGALVSRDVELNKYFSQNIKKDILERNLSSYGRGI